MQCRRRGTTVQSFLVKCSKAATSVAVGAATPTHASQERTNGSELAGYVNGTLLNNVLECLLQVLPFYHGCLVQLTACEL